MTSSKHNRPKPSINDTPGRRSPMLLSDESKEERTSLAGADAFAVAVDKAPEEGLPLPYCLPIDRRPPVVLRECYRRTTGEGKLTVDPAPELSSVG